MWGALVFALVMSCVAAKLNEDDPQDVGSSSDDGEESLEHIGATIAQVHQYPYAAALLLNNSYICSAVILNNYWILVLSKCFNNIKYGILSSYVAHKNLSNYTVRVGSSYNGKGGFIYKIKMLINNFDHHVSAAKLESPIEFTSQVQGVRLPGTDENVSLGYLATIIAWTPNGHMRAVNAPVIEPSICERNTRMLPGHYVCLGGVQDPNRHFCRRDNGGAVIQNSTLIAITSFINSCALYSKTHAFPKATAFSPWLTAIMYDEDSQSTTITKTEPPSTTTSTSTTTITTKAQSNATERSNTPPYFVDPAKFMLTLPFDPINVPLEPAEDNSVLPRMSLYESYLQSMAKNRLGPSTQETSTTVKQAITKVGKGALAMQLHRHIIPKRYDFDYN